MGGEDLSREETAMAQGSSAGKVVLYVVLGIIVIVVAGNILGWLLGALWNILIATLIIAAIAGVAMLVIGAARRSVGGNERRRLPR
jgi:predicted permease